MNKRALIGGLTATLGMINIAAAQAPDRNAPTGPYNPNPPANAPDLRLPPPCAPTPNLASNQAAEAKQTAMPGQATTAPPPPNAQPQNPRTPLADTQCAEQASPANKSPATAPELPGAPSR
jgi:hypothetical protein